MVHSLLHQLSQAALHVPLCAGVGREGGFEREVEQGFFRKHACEHVPMLRHPHLVQGAAARDGALAEEQRRVAACYFESTARVLREASGLTSRAIHGWWATGTQLSTGGTEGKL